MPFSKIVVFLCAWCFCGCSIGQDYMYQDMGGNEKTHPFVLPLHNMTAIEGDHVTVSCVVFGHSKDLMMEWWHHKKKNGSYTTMSGEVYVHIKATKDSSRVNNLALNLLNVNATSSGWYTCFAKNWFGEGHDSFFLAIDKYATVTPNYVELMCVGFGLAGILIIVIIITCACKGRRGKNNELELCNLARVTQQTGSPDDNVYTVPDPPEWEIPRSRLRLANRLGEGEFGLVFIGHLYMKRQAEMRTVAVKTLKANASQQEIEDFQKELLMLQKIGRHKNIVNFIGCCSGSDGPIQIIVEYASRGDLRMLLKNSHTVEDSVVEKSECVPNTLRISDLMVFAYQVASGMKYLASKQCVHRDLAARNILVMQDYTLKIADFGLSRTLNDHDYYRKTTSGRLPIKWISPEALLYWTYTVKSDVWAYGILLWEIYSSGARPYPAIPIQDLLSVLDRGYRMQKPDVCPQNMYTLIRRCWLKEPEQRPDFVEISSVLELLLTKSLGLMCKEVIGSFCNESYIHAF